jgi:uncharacterized peroxidase-related enzyme
MFLKTIAEADASGRIAELYAEDVRDMGVLMSATTCFTVRSDILPLWTDFLDGVKAGFTLSPREWKLITFIAAIEVPSTYCVTVYAQRLLADLGTKEAVLALRRDFRNAGLPVRDVVMLAYAQKVARAAHEVTPADVDALRAHGFSDPQIADIALCASLRCFMSRYFEATGAGPEAKFIDEDEAFRDAMMVGRRAEVAG